MSRIKEKFKELAAKNEKALIPYIMVGFPNTETIITQIKGLVKGGADIIELGFPFSDPLADGIVIQNAGNISLENGMNMNKFLEIVKNIRKETSIPLILMTYINIIYQKGYEKFISNAKRAGIDGFIIPDMSIEESQNYLLASKNANMDTIFLISPNTNKSRIKKIASISSGFLYLVAIYGTTGAKTTIKEYTIKAIKDTKQYTNMPVGVGFGISNSNDVKKYVMAGADAIIVGSAYLKLIEKTPQKQLETKIASFTRSLKKQTVKKNVEK